MKILIIGNVASGKTTFAKKLSNKLKIKYYELDNIVFDSKNNKRSLTEQKQIINNINKNDNFILEGTLRHNLYFLLSLADQIYFLNPSIFIIKFRIIKRYFKQKIQLEKANYDINLSLLKSMFKWANEFEKNKNNFMKLLNKYQNKLIIIK